MKAGLVALALALLGLVLWSVLPSMHDGAVRPEQSAIDSEAKRSTPSQRTGVQAPESSARVALPAASEALPPVAKQLEDYQFRVLSPAGAAVANAKITVERGGQRSEYSADAAGIARIPRTAFDGKWTLFASDAERAASGDLTRMSFLRGLADSQDIELYPLLTVRGRVVTGSKLASDDFVSIRAEGTAIGRGTPRERPKIAIDVDGHFECTLEANGAWFRFTATLDGEQACETRVRIGSGFAEEVMLQCDGSSVLGGVVLTPSGTPVGAATVHLLQYDPEGRPRKGVRPLQQRTEEDGRFRFELREREGWILLAEADDWCSSAPLAVDLDPVLTTTTIEVRLVDPTVIAGEVVWEDGRPVVGASVYALRDEAHRPELDRVFGTDLGLKYGFLEAVTDEQGRFELHPVRPGEGAYKLIGVPDMTLRDRRFEESGVAPGTRGMRIVLSEERLIGGVLEVRVTLADTGEPLTQSTWMLYELAADGSTSTSLQTYSNPEGRFRKEGLRPGSQYSVAILPVAGHLTALIDPWTAELGVHEVAVQLPLPVRVEFLAPDLPDGSRPARIELRAIDPHPYEDAPWNAVVGTGGRAVFHLRPGDYRTSCAGADGPLDLGSIHVPEGESTIVLAPSDE